MQMVFVMIKIRTSSFFLATGRNSSRWSWGFIRRASNVQTGCSKGCKGLAKWRLERRSGGRNCCQLRFTTGHFSSFWQSFWSIVSGTIKYWHANADFGAPQVKNNIFKLTPAKKKFEIWRSISDTYLLLSKMWFLFNCRSPSCDIKTKLRKYVILQEDKVHQFNTRRLYVKLMKHIKSKVRRSLKK